MSIQTRDGSSPGVTCTPVSRIRGSHRYSAAVMSSAIAVRTDRVFGSIR